MARVDFWFEFASTYSYLAAERVEATAAAAGVTLRWRPFLLGPIFAAQGWTSSPFNLYAAKGRYMWRDVERIAAGMGLPPIVRPEPFPQNGLLAARLALIGRDRGWTPAFVRAVFRAEFAEGKDIAKPQTLGAVLDRLALDPVALLTQARNDEAMKTLLKRETEEAQRRGIFGAPSFTAEDGELFWGNDRMEEAFTWATEVHEPADRRKGS
jgi:2-hydroxychromene-2-carboxylate isomerase